MTSALDALRGVGEFERPRSPEPSLLPFLARLVPVTKLERAAQDARVYVTDYLAGADTPAIGRATARALAARVSRIPVDELRRAADALPMIGSLVDNTLGSDSYSAELAVRVAVRAGSEERALSAIATAFDTDERVRLGAIAVPILGGADAIAADAVAAVAELSVETIGILVHELGPAVANDLLPALLSSTLPVARIVASIVEMVPYAPNRAAVEATGLIEQGALEQVDEWRVSYLIDRLRETEHGADAHELDALAGKIDPAWQAIIGRSGLRDRVDDAAALLRSHPQSAEIAEGPIRSADAVEVMREIADMWLGAPPLDDSWRMAARGNENVGRYLAAVVTELDATGERARTDGFALDKLNRVGIYLAVDPVHDGVRADLPLPVTDEVELFVSFFAAWLPVTDPRSISVPPTGDSQRVSVEFVPPTDLDRVELTIVISERGEGDLTPIQTGVLAGDIVADGEVGGGITLRIDPRPPRPVRPRERIGDGLTLVLGDDQLAVYGADADGSFRRPGELKQLRVHLGDRVLALWAEVERSRDDALANRLVQLAAEGGAVREHLERRLTASEGVASRLFGTNETIRLWSRDLDVDLPLEFVFAGDPRRVDRLNPRTCSKFHRGLEQGACQGCDDHGPAICAFDFWGFSRRIERRVIDPHDTDAAARLSVASAATIAATTTPAAFGASTKVTAPQRQAVIDVINDGGGALKRPVSGWDEWADVLRSEPHRLLVLLSHTEGATELEIEGDRINRTWITEDAVNPQELTPGPIVLLTGCDTARPDPVFLSFVSRFLNKGAAIVVGTLALMSADSAAEATGQVLQCLRDVVAAGGDHPRTVGEVMRLTRCRLLAADNLLGLNLVAYGDADWNFEQLP